MAYVVITDSKLLPLQPALTRLRVNNTGFRSRNHHGWCLWQRFSINHLCFSSHISQVSTSGGEVRGLSNDEVRSPGRGSAFLSVALFCSRRRKYRNGTVLMSASVHDPPIIKVDDTYYVLPHSCVNLRFEKLTQIESRVHDGNRLIPNVYTEL